MRYRQIVLAGLGCAALAGCAHPDAVLFVTNTSLGINVESKPPTVSVAYDRTEGYIAPRYDNGALPPVVASIQTGGNIFNPKIRQVYATGQAAVRATGDGSEPSSNPNMTGGRQLAFFGTNTTVGFKVGFDGQATVPDTFLFGYRRKEFSYIPLGTDPKTGNDTYASALASVDSNTATTGTGGVAGAAGIGLDHAQFIATGLAADNLARNDAITRAFRTIAAGSVTASLSPEDRAKAIAAGNADAATNNTKLDQVITAVQTNGQLDQTKLGALIQKANTAVPASIGPGLAAALQSAPDAASLRAQLQTNQPAVNALATAAAS